MLVSLLWGLDEAFIRMLININKVSIEDIRRILALLCYASRPSTVPEPIGMNLAELGDNPLLTPNG